MIWDNIVNRPFAWWRHFTTMTRILQGFAFLCKLGLLLFKPHWDYQILNMKRKMKRILEEVKWCHHANGLLRKILEVSSSILPQVLQTLLTYITYLLVLNKAGKRERKAIVYVSYGPKAHVSELTTLCIVAHMVIYINFVSQNQQKIAIYSQKQLASHA